MRRYLPENLRRTAWQHSARAPSDRTGPVMRETGATNPTGCRSRRIRARRSASSAMRRRNAPFLDALTAGRMHHAWLLGARRASASERASPTAPPASVLAAGKPQSARRQRRPISPCRRPTRRAAGSWRNRIPTCMCCAGSRSRTARAAPADIPVDAVRRLIDRFGSSAAEGGWRVCIDRSRPKTRTARPPMRC